MITHEYSTLFGNDSIDKQLVITTDNGAVTITNTELHNEAFSLEEKICDENNLVFGLAEPSKLEFTVSNVFTDLKNQWLTVTTTLNKDTANSFQIGRYKVYSDIPTADRKKRNVVAYDALYDVLQADVSTWYNIILPGQNSTTTLKAFRNSFFTHFGIEQEEVTLVNDNMVVAKTIEPEELSGKTVINAICEINGCFGHIGRNGKFKYVFLEQIKDALYPSHDLYPSEDLYPIKVTGATLTSGLYIPPATYESYVTSKISGLVIRQEEEDIGSQVGSMDNAYVIQDNFLVYGKSASDLDVIGNNVLGVIKDIVYRPFNTKAKGNFCVEVGDFIRLSTKTQRIESYVLQRTITGIQALRDDYSAEGEEKLGKSVNSTSTSIIQLKGKYNKLTRTVDETRLEMGDIEKELYATISVTAGEIRTEVQDVNNDLQSQIDQNSRKISFKVSSSEVESMIEVALNEITISSDQINLEGYTTINGGFSIDTEGNMILSNRNCTAKLSGSYLLIQGTKNDAMIGPDVLSIGGYSVARTSSSGLVIGSSSVPIQCSTINGNTPITSGNISDYVDASEILSSATTYDIEADVNSSGNIRFNGKTAVSTTYLSSTLSDYATSNELSALETDINNKMNGLNSGLTYVSTRISDLESRVSALEKAI